MEVNTEIYCETLDQATRNQSEKGRRDNMSMGVKTMMAISTETTDLS